MPLIQPGYLCCFPQLRANRCDGRPFDKKIHHMLNAIAIDDEPIALEVIKTLSANIPFLELQAVFTNAFEALVHLKQAKTDLIFLDISMPDISGIDFLQSIPRPPLVIFTTAYSEHAVRSFELDAIDYLLKPFSQARFLKACNKAYHQRSLLQQAATPVPSDQSIFLKSGYEQIRVNLGEILYLESSGNYVQFILSGRKILSRLSMQEAADLLPVSSFVRIHRCYLVSRAMITRIERNTIWINQISLPVGSAYQREIEKITRRL